MEKFRAGQSLLKEGFMKNLLLVMLLVIMASGCATVPNSVAPAMPAIQPSERVSLGMTRPMVCTIMDGRVAVRYQIDAATGVSKPVEAQNLYSSEIVRISGTAYQVDRYLLRSPFQPVHITEVELFPVVYKNGLVVARGYDALKALERGAVEK
jgi:hypothetical protein